MLSFVGQALGQRGWACPDHHGSGSTACGLVLGVFSRSCTNGALLLHRIASVRCITNRRTHHSDMPCTSGTHRNTCTDGFGCRHTMLAEYHYCQHLKMWIPSKRRRRRRVLLETILSKLVAMSNKWSFSLKQNDYFRILK